MNIRVKFTQDDDADPAQIPIKDEQQLKQFLSCISASYLIHGMSKVNTFDELEENVTYSLLRNFDQAHIESITKNRTWQDVGKNMEFRGRKDFSKCVLAALEELAEKPRPISPALAVRSDQARPPPDSKTAKALVYSSVAGSGKTISMLELKSTLTKDCSDGVIDKERIVVAYLGFNVSLPLSGEEKRYIVDRAGGAEEVLARRLAAATIISMNNPDAVRCLPSYADVYENFSIPTVRISKQMLATFTNASATTPIFIIAGVDEVQLLNSTKVEGTGLGRYFLRKLREWQYLWFNDGIRILPLGTGIALNWLADPTFGHNKAIAGRDATLIAKEDFRLLVENVISKMEAERINKFSNETIIDLISAAYWPRVRLLEHWRDGRPLEAHEGACGDSWLVWFSRWLRVETMSSSATEHVPDLGNEEGKIFCLFEVIDSERYSVIPDGYSLKFMIEGLRAKLPVPGLYDGLNILKTLEPTELITRDCYEFENLGFHVICLAIHAGLYALRLTGSEIYTSNASTVQKQRLGLALWFKDNSAIVTSNGTNSLLVPTLMGQYDSTQSVMGDYYPFTCNKQTWFQTGVIDELKAQAQGSHCPLYIRCGRNTCCDYIYFYFRKVSDGGVELLCYAVDSKHTAADTVDGQTSQGVTTSEQLCPFDALINIQRAVGNASLMVDNVPLKLGRALPVILSNKKRLTTAQDSDGKKNKARTALGDEEMDIYFLCIKTFDLGPLTDILWARRKSAGKKRKHEEESGVRL